MFVYLRGVHFLVWSIFPPYKCLLNIKKEKEPCCCCCCCWVASVVSNFVRPHRSQPTRLPRPWDSPGKNTGVGCHFLLQCMKMKSESEVAQSCLTLHDPMGCSLPGSSVHGIFQARVLEWGAIAFSEWKLTCHQKDFGFCSEWQRESMGDFEQTNVSERCFFKRYHFVSSFQNNL